MSFCASWSLGDFFSQNTKGRNKLPIFFAFAFPFFSTGNRCILRAVSFFFFVRV